MLSKSPMSRRIRSTATNAARLQAEIDENGDEDTTTTTPSQDEAQVPQRERFVGRNDSRSFDENGDRLESDEEEEIDETAPEVIPRRPTDVRRDTRDQRVLFEEPVPAIVIVDGVPTSTFDLEEVEIENSSERSSVGFPRSRVDGKLEAHRFREMEISAPASAISVKKGLMERFSSDQFVAEPETFIVNKICALVPMEGTGLGNRFLSTLRSGLMISLLHGYKELLKEQEVKERFLSFEKDFESSVGAEIMQLTSSFVGWMIEHLNCTDEQALGLALVVIVRRLMADKKATLKYQHAKLVLDVLGCYVSVKDSGVADFKAGVSIRSISGDVTGGDFTGLYRLDRSIQGVGKWKDEFGDLIMMILELLQGVEHVTVDVTAAIKAFKILKGQKVEMSQRLNKDGTVEGVMFWHFRLQGALSLVIRVATLAKRPEKIPSVNEIVEVAMNTLNVTFIEKGIFKVLEGMEDLCWTQDKIKIPIFATWDAFLAVCYKAEVLIRKRELTGWRVPAVVNYVPAVTGAVPGVSKVPGAAEVVCPHFAKYGKCKRGLEKCSNGTHPGQKEATVRRDAEVKAKEAKEGRRKDSDDVMVAEESEFVPPAPVGESVAKGKGAKGASRSGADAVLVGEVVYKDVSVECRECKQTFEYNERRYVEKNQNWPKTCPPCCFERARRLRDASALMIEASNSDEESEEDVMMVYAAKCSYYERCEAEAGKDRVGGGALPAVDCVQVAIGEAVAVGLSVESQALVCAPCVLAGSVVAEDASSGAVGGGGMPPMGGCVDDGKDAIVQGAMPWVVLQGMIETVHAGTMVPVEECFREVLHHSTLKKLVRETAPYTVYVDDLWSNVTVAWTDAVIKVLQRMQRTESMEVLVHGSSVNEEFWLQQLINEVLGVDDAYSSMERRTLVLNDGSSVAYLTERGVGTVRDCYSGVMFILGKRYQAAIEARWVKGTSRLRMVCKEFAAGVSWYGTQDSETARLRDFRSGRQRTLGEFFDEAVPAFGGWHDASVIESMAATTPAMRAYRGECRTEGDESEAFRTMTTDDEAMVSQFAVLHVSPFGSCAEGLGIKPTKNRFAVLAELDVSSGNSELDARVQLDADELLKRLKMATAERAKRVCQQITPIRDVWRQQDRSVTSAELAEEFEAQESDSSEGSVPELDEMCDDDESGGDSEYWEAVHDSDLSDATVRTDGESESSDSDFR
jgi:hypothetical protein